MSTLAIQSELLLNGITDTNGKPLSGGKVYTYAAGTTTNKTCWADKEKTTTETNPVILDSAGKKLIYCEGIYKFVIKTSSDQTLYTYDNLYLSTQPQVATVVYTSQYTNLSNAITAAADKELVLDSSITLVSNVPNMGSVGSIRPQCPGVIVSSGYSININCPVVGNPMHQWLSGFSPGDVILPRSVPARPEWWGAVGNGTTDDTVALNCALKSNNTLALAGKDYGTTGLLFAVTSANDRSLDNIRIIGEGYLRSSINLLAGSSNNYVLKFQGSTPQTPQVVDNFIESLYMSDLFLSGGITKTGLDGFCLYRPTFHNVRSAGQNYGFKLRSCINVNWSGITSVDYCNVGIKVPEYKTSGATIDNYNWGINVSSFEMLFARSCIKASMSLGCSGQMTITNMLAEGVPVIFYMYGYTNFIVVQNVGVENNTTPSANDNSVKDKFGNYKHWLLYTGIDEDGTSYATTDIYNIKFEDICGVSQGSCHLKNCKDIEIDGYINETSIELEGTCSDIRPHSLSTDKKTNTIIPGIGRPTSKRNALKSGFNLIANGVNTYPNNAGYDSSSGVMVRTTATLNGNLANVLRMTLPIGQATTTYQIRLPRTLYGDYDASGQMKILVEAHVKASTALVTNIAVKLTAHDSGNVLGLTNLTDYVPTLSSTNWNVITTSGITATNDNNTGCWLFITATRSNTSGTDYLYIADLIARDASVEYITVPSVFDVLAGFCYKGVTVDYGSGGFYVEFAVPDGINYAEYYEVIATSYGTTITGAGVAVEKGNGYFRVRTTAGGITVVAQLIPLQAVSA